MGCFFICLFSPLTYSKGSIFVLIPVKLSALQNVTPLFNSELNGPHLFYVTAQLMCQKLHKGKQSLASRPLALSPWRWASSVPGGCAPMGKHKKEAAEPRVLERKRGSPDANRRLKSLMTDSQADRHKYRLGNY